FRPVHIGALLLGAVSPEADSEFLYAGNFHGEAARVLNAVAIDPASKPWEAVLAEFQRGGFLLAHVLECPLEQSDYATGSAAELIVRRIPSVFARIRRSLRPKRLVPISEQLQPFLETFTKAELASAILLDGGVPFALDSANWQQAQANLRKALSSA